MSVKTVVPGVLVTKAAQNIPQTATANLFTLAGGAVLVTGLLGLVTTVIGAVATTLSLGTTPAGAATSVATATAITNAGVGTVLAPVSAAGQVGGPLSVAGAVYVAAPPFIINPFMVGGGNITWTTSASTTGQIKWYLWYVPLDFDATVS